MNGIKYSVALIASVMLAATTLAQSPVGTTFTYQGQLKENGVPFTGLADLTFRLFASSSGGVPVGEFLLGPVAIAEGLFTVEIDFGAGPFAMSEARWVEIVVDDIVLTPRQRLRPTPFSLATRGINVDASGDVGIGTVSPTANLHLSGPSTTLKIEGTTGGAQLELSSNSSGPAFVWTPTGTDELRFDVGGGDRLTITPTGNVGVGTTAPSSLLHVQQATDTNLSGALVTNSAINRSLHLWVDEGSRGRIDVGTTADSPIIFNGNGPGNIGIGTMAPAAKLHVSAASGTLKVEGTRGGAQLELSSNSSGSAFVWSPTGTDELRFEVGGTDRFTVMPTGEVGIGTTTPTSILQVRNTTDDAAVSVQRASQTAGDIALLRFKAAIPTADSDYRGALIFERLAGPGFAPDGKLHLAVGSSSPQGSATVEDARLTIMPTGFVGIGTTNPGTNLDIAGAVRASGVVESTSGGVRFPDGVTWTSGASIGDIQAVNAGLGLSGGGTSGSVTLNVSFAGTGSANSAARSDHYHNSLSASDGIPSNAVFVDAAGEVGIGTTSPSAQLHVENGISGNAVRFQNSAPGFATLIVTNGTDDLAAHFQDSVKITGNLEITGNLSKGSGSFKIDHPLDPGNKYLYHSFVESPDMMNIYNGIVVTNGCGYATIDLPEWFGALNRDFRYQLTVLDEADGDEFVLAKVTSQIRENRFTIRSSAPHVQVSWGVTGIRQDAFANMNRVPIEECKTPSERGCFLHPEAFGRSSDFGLHSED